MKSRIAIALLLAGILVSSGVGLYTYSLQDPAHNANVVWLKGTTLIGKGNGSTQMGWANITVKGNMTLIGAWKAPGGGDMLVAPLVKVGNKTIPWIMDWITLADAGTLNWTLSAGNYAVVYITNGKYIEITQTVMLVSN